MYLICQVSYNKPSEDIYKNIKILDYKYSNIITGTPIYSSNGIQKMTTVRIDMDTYPTDNYFNKYFIDTVVNLVKDIDRMKKIKKLRERTMG